MLTAVNLYIKSSEEALPASTSMFKINCIQPWNTSMECVKITCELTSTPVLTPSRVDSPKWGSKYNACLHNITALLQVIAAACQLTASG